MMTNKIWDQWPNMTVNDPQIESTPPAGRNWRMRALVMVLVGFGLFLLALVLMGQFWRAVAYGVVALFAFLVVLAVYFWGALLFGGVLDVFSRERTPVPWSLDGGASEVPEHDIDPGLELLAAGMLVYREGTVKPQPHFRQVPLTNARALRPFIVARSGVRRTRRFLFVLDDEADATQFHEDILFPLRDQPQVVMPPYRLVIEPAQAVAGQRWTLRVRSGVTVVSTVRFWFTNGRALDNAVSDDSWQRTDLSRLLDDAVKRDAMTQTEDIVLEDV